MAKKDKTIYDGGETTIRGADITAQAANETCADSGETVLSAETVVSVEDIIIEKGSSLLDTYRVESDAIQGGMGKVWRVRHTGWNVELAMKQPKAELFQNEQQKADFIHECEAWINLGLHPQIVSCYYVREIGGVPSIFAEWMEGGSLKNWIYSGKLYEGDSQVVLERVLDIAIQFGRGLHYAHEQGLIHQDVKPDNLLLTPEGEAKVADFGIANARAVLTVQDHDAAEGATMISASGAYTPAYCSMEQFNGVKLTRRTDIYSWAVSVLEMFLGDRLWPSGIVAGEAIEDYLSMDMRVPMPEGMKTLLRVCLNERPEKRPHDFAEIDAVLLQIYQDATGLTYLREFSKAAADTADSLNNRALSFLDLGMREEAEKLWEKALALSPRHCSSLYNQSLHLWRGGGITDAGALNAVESGDGQIKLRYLAQLHLERCSPQKAQETLEKLPADDQEAVVLRKTAEKMLEQGESFTVLRQIASCEDDIMDVTWSEDGVYVLLNTRGKPNTILLYDARTGEHMRSFICNASYTLCMCFSPDNRLVAAGDDGDIAVWEMDTGRRVDTLKIHRNEINNIMFTRDGSRILSCSCDGTAILWDVRMKKTVQVYGDHGCFVSACRLSPDETRVLTGDSRGMIRVWDTVTGQCLQQYRGHTSHVRSLCLDKENGRILSAGADWAIVLWDVNRKVIVTEITTGLAPVSSYCFEKDGNRVFVFSGERGKTAIVDAQTGRHLQTVDSEEAQGTAFYPCSDGRSWLFKFTSNSKLSLLTVPSFRYRSAFGLCRVESSVAVSELERNFRMLEREIKQCLESGNIVDGLKKAYELRNMPVWGRSSQAFQIRSQVGKYCVKTGISGIMRIDSSSWTIAFYERALFFTFSPTQRITALRYSNAPLSEGIDSRSVMIHDARTGKLITKLEGEGDGVIDPRFNKDGSKLMIICGPHYKIFDCETWAEEKTGSFALSYKDVNKEAEKMGFYKQQHIEHQSARESFRLVQERIGKRYIKIHNTAKDIYTELPESAKDAMAAFISTDGNQIEVVYRPFSYDDSVCEYVTYAVEWDYHFPGWTDWDDDALPYLEYFIARYPDEYTAENFNALIVELQNHGFGYIRPEGVRTKLDELQFGW